VEYYLHITRKYVDRYGDYGYPEILIYSVSFQSYVDWPEHDRWDLVAQGLTEGARKLEAAGADFVLIATNTMHLVFDQVQAGIDVPMLSLLEAVADVIVNKGMRTVGLLGTKFAMENGFYQDALARKGISVLVPDANQRDYVNNAIYNELVAGQIREDSRVEFVAIIKKLAADGAQGVILGCTEIPLLVDQADTELPLLDTTAIHAEAALNYAVA
jgi:aspartate racemase